jgi:very-short-patch-repair endonuclease
MPTSTFYANLLKKYLKKLGIKVENEVSDGFKHVDLSMPGARLDIEVDGEQHLTDPDQIMTDYTRAYYSREAGYETIHVHNKDLIEDKDARAIASAIAEVSAIREEAFDIMSGFTTDPSSSN